MSQKQQPNSFFPKIPGTGMFCSRTPVSPVPRVVLAACLAWGLGGCSSGPGLDPASQEAPRYVSSPPVIQLTANGLGAIGPDTPYSKQAIAAALPGFTFAQVKAVVDGRLKWNLAAFKNGLQQVQFEPGPGGRKIARIHLVGQEGAGPNGERLGMSFGETKGSRLACSPGRAEWDSMALCKTPDGALTYLYSPPNYDGPDGTLPPAEQLARARLVRLIWTAPRG